MQVTSGARAGRASTPTDHDRGPGLSDAPSIRPGVPGSGTDRWGSDGDRRTSFTPRGEFGIGSLTDGNLPVAAAVSCGRDRKRHIQADRLAAEYFRGAHMHIRGDHAELVVGGRLDVRSAADARTVLHSAVDDGAGDLVLNLTELD